MEHPQARAVHAPPQAAGCTIIAKNYLAYARVLAQSFLRHHPGWPFYVLLVDRVDGCFDPSAEPFDLVSLDDLAIPDREVLCFRYTTIELSTAVKPFFLSHLFARHGVQKVVFLDPDILVLKPLRQAVECLDRHAIVLTPHLTEPLDDDGRRPSERTILQAGAYNLGFLGLRWTSATAAFLSWWQDRLRTQCEMAPEQGMHVDQKWIDLVPGLFGDVGLIRDPGYNVAYWNLPNRPITIRNEEVQAAGAPCVCFHFSGFDPKQPHQVSKHQNRLTWDGLGEARMLFGRYRNLLLANGYARTSAWPYTFGTFDDGTPIPDAARRLYRRIGFKTKRFGNPFATIGASTFFTWLNGSVGLPWRRPRVTRLWHAIHSEQPYLQRVFPDVLGVHREPFLRWVQQFGRVEYAIADRFVPGLAQSSWAARPSESKFARVIARLIVRVEPWLKPLAKQWIRSDPVAWDRLRTLRYRLSHRAVAHRATRVTGQPVEPRPWGINVLGYFSSEKGMGESARASLRALSAAAMPCVANNIDDPTAFNHGRYPVTKEHPYRVNLIHVNADQVPTVAYSVGDAYLSGLYNIGYWTWELPEFPRRWRSSFDYFDEIWVPSRFVSEAVARTSPVPVIRMPHAIDLETLRKAQGAPAPPEARDRRTTFLFLFDFMSYWQRKNPFGLIDAFTRAFSQRDDVKLIIKTMHASFAPSAFEALQAASHRAPITVVDGVWDRQDTVRLLARCDCFVSLHRAEGFGLCLAEAMALGKPVIATGYSGNLDFMTDDNSLLVHSRLVPLSEDCGPYARGNYWAEPDLEHAVEQLRWVVGHPERARALGVRAARTIQETISPRAVSRLMKDRFASLHLLEWSSSPQADPGMNTQSPMASDELQPPVMVRAAQQSVFRK